ncbi:hypothetical protein [Aeromonas jandaei]|uniref:hypothetical protein n=1 Tax=Aeromonas jandaei TaxID=650 RepID=UPI0011161DE9|nr:hypothetical protein [Aeromonas jandaei]TNI04234.1 hypothetical protein CF104_08235 [Aeromonas jandaei]
MAFIDLSKTKAIRENIIKTNDFTNIEINNLLEDLSTYIESKTNNLTVKPFKHDSFVRLSEHFRSICFSFAGLDFSIKGLEPFLDDVDDYLELFSKKIDFFSPSTGNRFIFNENKLPFVFTKKEAELEIFRSIEMIDAYTSTYNTMPKIPIPVAYWNFEIENIFTSRLRHRFKIDASCEQACVLLYLNFYTPSRVGHYDAFLNSSFQTLQDKEIARTPYGNFTTWISNIITEFSRWLNIGYIPAEIGKKHLGYSIKPQNVGMQGSIYDIGSFLHATEMTDAELDSNIFQSLDSITSTIAGHISLDYNKNSYQLDKIYYPLVIGTVLESWPTKIVHNEILNIVRELHHTDIIKFAYKMDSLRYRSNEFEDIII